MIEVRNPILKTAKGPSLLEIVALPDELCPISESNQNETVLQIPIEVEAEDQEEVILKLRTAANVDEGHEISLKIGQEVSSTAPDAESAPNSSSVNLLITDPKGCAVNVLIHLNLKSKTQKEKSRRRRPGPDLRPR